MEDEGCSIGDLLYRTDLTDDDRLRRDVLSLLEEPAALDGSCGHSTLLGPQRVQELAERDETGAAVGNLLLEGQGSREHVERVRAALPVDAGRLDASKGHVHQPDHENNNNTVAEAAFACIYTAEAGYDLTYFACG